MEKSLENNLIDLFNNNRLKSYKFNDDNNTIILERYLYNIEVSKSL